MKKYLGFLVVCNMTYGVNIDDVYNHIKIIDNGLYLKYDGITYGAPSNNFVESDQWVMQTPKLWGYSLDDYKISKKYSATGKYDPVFKLPKCNTDSDCGKLSKCTIAQFTERNTKLCLLPEHLILNKLASSIVNANYYVDISQLTQGFTSITSEEFTETIKNSLTKLAMKSIKENAPIEVRLLEGSIVPLTLQKDNGYTTLYQYLKYITSKLHDGNQLIVSVASERSCNPLICRYSIDPLFGFSWNHAKFLAVDGDYLITGGQQFNGPAYLGDNPVNDSMIELYGPIAQTATQYSNIMWDYVNKNKGVISNYCWTYESGNISSKCITRFKLHNSISRFNFESNMVAVKTMFVAKLNHGVLPDDADQSETSRVYAFKHANKSIKISQQAIFNLGVLYTKTILGPVNTLDGNVIDALGYAIYHNNVDVSIITSNRKGGQSGWSSKVPLEFLYNSILENILTQFPSAKRHHVEAMLAEHLHLSYIDFNHSNNDAINNHNKFWMVDDHLFYFGSHNIYPSALQQYGVIMDSYELANQINLEFWIPMYSNSNKISEVL